MVVDKVLEYSLICIIGVPVLLFLIGLAIAGIAKVLDKLT